MVRFVFRPACLILLFLISFTPTEVFSVEDETHLWPSDTYVVGMLSEDAPAIASITNYTTLTELIAMISEDAMQQFNDFFEASLVQVEPFSFLWEFEHRRPSMLGITLANQMAAMLNNYTLGARSNRDQYQPAHYFNQETRQWVQGTMQEMDGFLRIHISARNSNGARRSYVVNAQMSEPIYRALHTVPYRSRLHANNRSFRAN